MRQGRFVLLAPFLLGLFVGCDEHLIPEPSRPTTTIRTDAPTGPLRVYFTNPGPQSHDPGNPAEILAGHVAKAEKTIDVCAFEVDNVVITKALTDAVKRGVHVRLVTETDYLEDSGTQELKQVGVPVVDDQRDRALMHDKFMVFDHKSVWTGSMNFTENCAYRNNNNGIYLEDARLAENYATKFDWMFERHKFGVAPSRTDKIPNPVVTLSDGTIVENYFSTHDHLADHVIKQVGLAQKSIHFLAFSFTHAGIGKAMLNRAHEGVQVQGVFEKSQAVSSYSEYEQFRKAGDNVEVYLDANPRNMHHKVIVVDGMVTIAGSFNFSDSADKHNDENIVIIRNPAISQKFEEEFQKLFRDAKNVDGMDHVASKKK